MAIGKVTQIIGPVIDCEFDRGELPRINEAIKIANERARSKSADSSGRLITEQLLLSIKENS